MKKGIIISSLLFLTGVLGSGVLWNLEFCSQPCAIGVCVGAGSLAGLFLIFWFFFTWSYILPEKKLKEANRIEVSGVVLAHTLVFLCSAFLFYRPALWWICFFLLYRLLVLVLTKINTLEVPVDCP